MKAKGELLKLFLLLAVVSIVAYFLVGKQQSSFSHKDLPRKPVTHNETESSQFNLVPRVFEDDRVEPGLNLIPFSGPDIIALTDLSGKVINEWSIDAARARLLPGCRLLVIHGSKEGLRKKKWRDLKPYLTIYGPDGNEEWSYSEKKTIHHDVHSLEPGVYAYLQTSLIPFPDGHRLKPAGKKKAQIRSDTIEIVNENKEKLWEWKAHEHLDMNHCGPVGCETEEVKERRGIFQWDWTHMNTASPIPDNALYEKGNSEFRPGNFLIMPRHFWSAYIIAYPSGEVVWEYGGRKDGESLIVRGHEAHMIEKGLPGAGNILIFDNGLDGVREYSRILEIDPLSKEIIWSYEDRSLFYSRGGGSVQRLANGNTFISEDINGRIFEVTPEKEIVWEVITKSRLSRAHRYPASLCEK